MPEISTASASDGKDTCPELNANIFSRLLFTWAQPLFTRASELHKENKALGQMDLLALPRMDHGKTISPAFEAAWREAGPNPTLSQTLRQVIGRRFVRAGFVKVFNTMLYFSFPLLLNAILIYIEEMQTGKFAKDDPCGTCTTVGIGSQHSYS